MSEPDGAAPQTSASSRVLKGFLSMSASTFLVMGLQFGYAAVTSRLLPPSAFGAYAVALSGVGLLGMLGGSSLGLSAARRDHDSVGLDRSLITVAILLGSLSCLLAVVLAPPWGNLWGVPESVATTRLLALAMPLTAVAAVMAGILRRAGRTSQVAARSALAQIAGMVIGLGVILAVREPWSLAASPVAAVMVTVLMLAPALPRDRLRLVRPTRDALDDVLYATKSAGMNVLRYATTIAPSWAIGRWAGADALGSFNRATTLLTVPLENLQRSFSYSLFPELRPDGPVSRNPRAFTDLMVLVSWAAIVVGALGFFAAAPFLRLVLGPQWDAIGQVAGIAWLLGVIPMIGVPLGSMIEARGHFRIAGLAWSLGAVPVALGILGTSRTGSPAPAALGLVGYALVLAAVHLGGCVHHGFLDGPAYARGLVPAIVMQSAVTLLILLVHVTIGTASDVTSLVVVALVGLAEVIGLWVLRRRTPVGRIAEARALPGFRSRFQA